MQSDSCDCFIYKEDTHAYKHFYIKQNSIPRLGQRLGIGTTYTLDMFFGKFQNF